MGWQCPVCVTNRGAQGVEIPPCHKHYQCLQPRLASRAYYQSPVVTRRLMTWSWSPRDPSGCVCSGSKGFLECWFQWQNRECPSHSGQAAHCASNTWCWSSKTLRQLRVARKGTGVHISMGGVVKMLWPSLLYHMSHKGSPEHVENTLPGIEHSLWLRCHSFQSLCECNAVTVQICIASLRGRILSKNIQKLYGHIT